MADDGRRPEDVFFSVRKSGLFRHQSRRRNGQVERIWIHQIRTLRKPACGDGMSDSRARWKANCSQADEKGTETNLVCQFLSKRGVKIIQFGRFKSHLQILDLNCFPKTFDSFKRMLEKM